ESVTARRLLGGTPIVGGPHDVNVERDPNGTVVHASHDGYASDCDVVHHRAIRLSADGRVLDGEDSFVPVDGHTTPSDPSRQFAVRFHLHPAIKASRLADGRGVILLLQDREVWTFATLADSVEIEESVFLAGSDGPRRT